MEPRSLHPETIFGEAIQLESPEERAEFIRRACAGDSKLRGDIEKLVDDHFRAGQFLNSPAVVPTIKLPAGSERPGTQIGPYKLLQQIGEGGFGVVYMAEQSKPVRRKVALKIIKPGMDTRDVIARFEAERQALALMDHPNVARVLDAGATDSGRPYFVMELVKGIPISEFCDESHLSMRNRLELFVDVCRAVQHAHQKGIIHRDLKLSNIMVTMHDDKPVVKVIDFGVSKALSQQLTEKTLFTAYGQMIGTPLYMSPEQAQLSGLDVDTRSDVYSLGVLLYELLTGTTPFDKETLKKAGFEEIRRIICEDEPLRPSARVSTFNFEVLSTVSDQRRIDPRKLGPSYRGELDWIVMKAIEKDRNRRYESASAFAADIQRYLNDEAVQACPPSMGYRLQKYVRRRRAPLAMSLMFSLAVLIVVGGFGWMARDRAARIEMAARELANRQGILAARVEYLIEDAERLIDMEQWSGALSAAERAMAIVNSGPADAATRWRVDDALANVKMVKRLEEIPFLSKLAQLGAFSPVSFWPGDFVGDLRTLDSAYKDAFRDFGVDFDKLTDAEAIHRLKTHTGVEIPIALALGEWAGVRWQIDMRTNSIRNAEKITARKRLVNIATAMDPDPLRTQMRSFWSSQFFLAGLEPDRLLGEKMESKFLRTLPVTTLLWLELMLRQCGNTTEREQRREVVLRAAQQIDPANFWVNFRLGNLLLRSKEQTHTLDAIAYYRAALATRPANWGVYSNMAAALVSVGRQDESLACYYKLVELLPDDAYLRSFVGRKLRKSGKLPEAITMYRSAIEREPTNAKYQNGLGLCFLELGEWHDALPYFRAAVENDSKNAAAQNNLGLTLLNLGKPEEATPHFRRALVIDPKDAYSLHNLGLALRSMGRAEEAIAPLEAALKEKQDSETMTLLGAVLASLTKYKEAYEYFEKAISVDPASGHVCNDVAWFLVTCPDREIRDPSRAIELAERAVELLPGDWIPYNTLGVASYRAGEFEAVIAAMKKALELGGDDEPSNSLFLSMAYWQLDQKKLARDYYQRTFRFKAVQKVKPNTELAGFLEEAMSLMGTVDSSGKAQSLD